MSTANQQDTQDPNSLLYYAPRRLRDRADALRSMQSRRGDGGQFILTTSLDLSDTAALGQQAQGIVRPPGSFPETLRPLEPEAIVSLRLLSQRARRNEIFAAVTRFAAVACIAAGVAFLYVVILSESRVQVPLEGGSTSTAAMPQLETALINQPSQRTLTPKIADAYADVNINEPLPLDTKLITARPVATVSFPASAANAFLSAVPPAPETARRMDPKEIAALIKRGEELLSNGDIAAARLLLQRAAEARDARAAFALAGTYNQTLSGQSERSGGSDARLARVWYQRARDWGSPDASKQLEALASANR